MTTSTRNDSNDRDGPGLAARATSQTNTRAVVRCRLCGETVALESNFRPTPVECPHCGLKFVFNPQEEPLPVRGMRLRWSEVIEAQRRGMPGSAACGAQVGDGYTRRHDAHLPAAPLTPQSHTSYLGRLGVWALALAGLIASIGLLRGR